MNADYCIYRDCGRIIQYEESTAMIKCPWCSRAYLAREFSGERQKIEHALRAGEQARTALEVSEAERRELQARLNRVIDSLSDIAKAHEGVERNTGDILSGQRDMARTLNAINAKQDAVDTRYKENLDYAFVLLEIGEFGEANAIFDEVKRVAPREPQVYLGKLMADMHVTQRSDLAKCQGSFAENLNYKLLMHFADDALKSELEQYNAQASICVIKTETYTYEGEIKDGVMHGHGTCKYANGDVYVGSFENGRRHGKGRQTFAGGGWYDGDWTADRRSGQGTMVHANGDRYEGSFVQDVKSGEGCCFYHYGAKYEGQWINNKPAGEGTYTRSNGEKTEGYFANGHIYPKGIQHNFRNWITCSTGDVEIYRHNGVLLSTTNRYDLDRTEWLNVKQIIYGIGRSIGLKEDGTVVDTRASIMSSWRNVRRLGYADGHWIGIKTDDTLYVQNYREDTKYEYAERRMRVLLTWRNIVDVKAVPRGGVIGLKSDGTVIASSQVKKELVEGISEWSEITEIACTNDCIFGLMSNGFVRSVGWDEWGAHYASKWTDIIGIAAGSVHVAGLKKDGTVVACGYEKDGQTATSFWKNIVAITADSRCTIGVCADGSIRVAGKCDKKDRVETWCMLAKED